MTRPKDIGTIRSYTVLTNSYVAGTVISIDKQEQVLLKIRYKQGAAEAGNSVQFKIEYSSDNTTWYQESFDDWTATLTAGSTTSMNKVLVEHSFQTNSGDDYFTHEVPTNSRYLRISFKESGVAANYGSCGCDYLIQWTSQ